VEVHSTVNIHKCAVKRTGQTLALTDETQYEAKVCGIIIKCLKIVKFLAGIEDITD